MYHQTHTQTHRGVLQEQADSRMYCAHITHTRKHLLALSSRVLSIHCTDWVISVSCTSTIKCLPRAQQRSARIGLRLYGIADEPTNTTHHLQTYIYITYTYRQTNLPAQHITYKLTFTSLTRTGRRTYQHNISLTNLHLHHLHVQADEPTSTTYHFTYMYGVENEPIASGYSILYS